MRYIWSFRFISIPTPPSSRRPFLFRSPNSHTTKINFAEQEKSRNFAPTKTNRKNDVKTIGKV